MGAWPGLIAACRIARRAGDETFLHQHLPSIRQAMRDRLVHELSYTEGGVIVPVENRPTVFGRWRHLTPEVAMLINR